MSINVSLEKGFSLLEFVAVLALASGILLSYSQFQSIQHRQQLQSYLLTTVEAAKTALYQYYGTHRSFPHSLQEVMSTEQAATPWGGSLYLSSDDEQVLLVTPTPNARVQAWLLARLANSKAAGEEVVVPMPKPIQALSADAALHRVSVPNRPELNTMSTDLNMDGHSLYGFNFLEANEAAFKHIVAESVSITQLDVEELVSGLIVAEDASFQNLQSIRVTADELVAEHAEFAHVEVNTLLAEELSANALHAQQLTVETLTAQQLEVTNLVVESLQATDVITPQGSLLDAQERLQALEFAWIECVASGGCQ